MMGISTIGRQGLAMPGSEKTLKNNAITRALHYEFAQGGGCLVSGERIWYLTSGGDWLRKTMPWCH